LKTFERDKSQVLNLKQPVQDLAMGMASRGPLVIYTKPMTFLDIDTFEPLPHDVAEDPKERTGIDGFKQIRVSPNGKLLVAWRGTRTNPSGIQVWERLGPSVRHGYAHANGGCLAPDWHGTMIHTGIGGWWTP